jgi:hypothetical protein
MAVYAGFDRSDYPGGTVMKWLKANTNLSIAGYYLRAPSHPDGSWLGTRAELASQGWGFLPVYVGQETMGPGSRNVTAAQGALDGADVCAKMAAEGFAPGSFAYLDLENPDPARQGAYVAAWIDAVVAGGFGPGVYTSFMDARQIAGLRPGVRIWAFRVATVQPHHVGGKVFAAPDPATCGYSSAVAWQHDDEAIIPCAGAVGDRLICDLNSAIMPDPSAPLVDGVAGPQTVAALSASAP